MSKIDKVFKELEQPQEGLVRLDDVLKALAEAEEAEKVRRTTVNIAWDEALAQQVDALCTAHGISRTEYINRAVAFAVAVTEALLNSGEPIDPVSVAHYAKTIRLAAMQRGASELLREMRSMPKDNYTWPSARMMSTRL